MLRRLHSIAGLALALMLVAIAATGVGLSVASPPLDRLAYSSDRARRQRRRPRRGRRGAPPTRRCDPRARRRRGHRELSTTAPASRSNSSIRRTGAGLGAYQAVRDLPLARQSAPLASDGRRGPHRRRHRRARPARAEPDGTVMLARSLGGAGALLRPIRGGAARRWHGELGRLALAGLLLSSLTAAVSRPRHLRPLPAPRTGRSIAASGGPARRSAASRPCRRRRRRPRTADLSRPR